MAAHSMGDYARLLRRRWKYPVFIIPTALLIAVLVAYTLPVTYRAAATIMLESAALPQSMVQSTVTQNADFRAHASEQLELVRRQVMTTDTLTELVKQIDPYPRDNVSLVQKANRITGDTNLEAVDPITFQASDRSSAFSIYYLNENPKLAAEIDKKLADLFLAYNQKTRVAQSQQALRFLQQQAHELERTMQSQEKQLAQFKEKYGEALPNAENRNLSGVDRVTREIEGLQGQIVSAEQQESLLQLQLNDTAPSLTAAMGDWRTELAKQRADLAEAERKYTPEHPDVKRLRRSIADLIAANGGAASTGSAPMAKPDNPDYLRIQSQLNTVRRQLANLRAALARSQQSLDKYQNNLQLSPNVERQYTQLQRDYDNAENSYRDLQGKIKAAALASSLEAENGGERFTLMKAPSTPGKPYSPNRPGIMLLGLMLGTIIAVGAAIIADASDQTVRGLDDLQEVMEVTPVGAVPIILNRSDRRARRRAFGLISGGFVTAAALVAGLIVILR